MLDSSENIKHYMSEGRFFSRWEWLVVFAIVTIVSVLAAFAVNTARASQRDAVRILHMRQLGTVLESAFNEVNSYPSGTLLPIGDPTQSACLDLNGFHANCVSGGETLLRAVPPTPEKGLKGLVQCGDPLRSSYCYTQLREGEDYAMQFELEQNWTAAGLVKGVNCATPSGLSAGACRQ